MACLGVEVRIYSVAKSRWRWSERNHVPLLAELEKVGELVFEVSCD